MGTYLYLADSFYDTDDPFKSNKGVRGEEVEITNSKGLGINFVFVSTGKKGFEAKRIGYNLFAKNTKENKDLINLFKEKEKRIKELQKEIKKLKKEGVELLDKCSKK